MSNNNDKSNEKLATILTYILLVGGPVLFIVLFFAIDNIVAKVIFGIIAVALTVLMIFAVLQELMSKNKKRRYVCSDEEYTTIANDFFNKISNNNGADEVFPGGTEQIKCIIKSLIIIDKIDSNYKNVKIERCKYVFDLYLDVYRKIKMGYFSDMMIIKSLTSGDYSYTKEAAGLILGYIQINMNDNRFELGGDNTNILDEWVKQMNKNCELSLANKEYWNKNIQSDDYGKVPEKPIFTDGINQTLFYLMRLRNENGEYIPFSKTDSIAVEGINGIVNVYKEDKNNSILYLCPYSILTEESAPTGYSLQSVDDFFEQMRQNDNELNELSNIKMNSKISAPSTIEKTIIERFKDCDADHKYYLFKGCLNDGIYIIEKMLDIFKMDSNVKDNVQHCLFLCNLLYVELENGKQTDKLVEQYVDSNQISQEWTDSDDLMASAIKVYCNYYNSDESRKIKQIVLDEKTFEDGFSKENEIELEKKIVFAYFENKEYEKVIEVSKNYLEDNPKESFFYFETIQAYLRLEMYIEAKAVARTLVPYITNNAEKARLFRNIGCINIEEGDLKTAMACFEYSLMFETSPLAINEMEYIKTQDSNIKAYDKEEAESILRNEGLLFFDGHNLS